MKRLILFLALIVNLAAVAQVYTVTTIEQLEAYSGATTFVHVKDTLRGGDFNYRSGIYNLTVDNGIVFEAPTGYWQRDLTDCNYIDVRWYGAIPGDGIDDAPAINAAMQATKTIDIKAVYNCVGYWDIGTTVRYVDNVEWFGDGRENTILRAIPSAETGLDLITLVSGIVTNPDLFTYRTMVADEGADYSVSEITSGFSIRDMGFDWNSVPGGVNSVQELLLGRVTDYAVENIRCYDALPSDLEDVNEERQGHCLQIGFSARGFIDNVHLGASDYESLAIRYLSHDNHFGTIYGYVDKPDTYHWQSHIVQIARPTPAKEQLILQYGDSICRNNTFDKLILHTKNNVLHGLTTHSSEGVHIGTVYHKSYPGSLAWGVKFFDGSKNITIDTFIEDALDANTNAFPATSRGVTSNGVSFIGINSTSNHAEVDNVTIGNVLINVKNTVDYDGALPSYIAPMIGGCNISRGSNVTFGNVVVNIDGYDDYAKPVFGGFGDNITVGSLSINYKNPFETITSSGPVIAKIKEGDNIAINNIQVKGDIGNGVLIDDTDFHNVRLGSMVYEGNVAGVMLSTGLTNQSEIKVSANSVNGITADADGNIPLSASDVGAAPIDNPTFTTGITTPTLTIPAGDSNTFLTGTGAPVAKSNIRIVTIGANGTAGAMSQVNSLTTFGSAPYYLQNQINFIAPSLLVTSSTTVELVADSYHMIVVYEGSGDCTMRLPVMAGSDKVRTTIINKTAHTITINTENAGEMWVAGVDTNTTTLLNDKTVEFISDGTQHIKLN